MSDYDYDSITFYDFESYGNETRDRLYWLVDVVIEVSNAEETPEFIISLIGIFLNIFHLIILTRKSMRNTSINVLMIGIAFCDLFVMAFDAYSTIYDSLNPDIICDAPHTYILIVFEIFMEAMKDAFRRVSALLEVMMAATRFLIIKTLLNPKYEFLNNPSFSWTTILFLIIPSTVISLVDKRRFQIIEISEKSTDRCTENITETRYFVFVGLGDDEDTLIEEMLTMTDGFLRLVPAVLLPILAFLLIRELKKAASNRRRITNTQSKETSQKDHTTKLVVLMTVMSMIAEGPLGITYVVNGLLTTRLGFLTISNNITIILNIFVALNASTHCLICLKMSSQYRNCVKSLFCGKSKLKPVSTPSPSYIQVLVEMFLDAKKYSFRRVSAWLGVLMAATRLLIIKITLNPRYTFLFRSSFSWTVILILIILSSCHSLADKGRMEIDGMSMWTLPDYCPGIPENFTETRYIVFLGFRNGGDVLYEKMVKISEGLLKIIPAVLLPILTFLLVRELKTAANNRRKLTLSQETPQKDHTTKLVILMTVISMIAEGPLGIAFVAQGLLTTSVGFLAICYNITFILEIFVASNASTHCLICLAISTQYRNCVKDLFGRKSKPKMVTVLPKTSVSSVTSLGNVKIET